MRILLIAGLWLNATVWAEVATHLRTLGHTPEPITLPGQGAPHPAATLDDQLQTILTAIDSAPEPLILIGHSAACTLVWMAADSRPQKIAHLVMIGGFPAQNGGPYAEFFPITDKAMPFPGWSAFEGPDSADLTETQRHTIATTAIPVPAAVAQATIHLNNPARHAIPLTLICPEFSPAQARQWVNSGQIPELAPSTSITYLNIDSGHWPMLTQPNQLATILATIATS